MRTHQPALIVSRNYGGKPPTVLLIKTFKFMKKISINPFLFGRRIKKLLLIMKLTILLLLVALMQVSATVYSQSTKFKFRVENKQIVEVLKEIEESSNFRFFYIREQVDVERKVSVKANNATVEQILDELFEGEGINYRVMEDYLVLLSPENLSADNIKMLQQQNTVTGKVTDESGQPLPGVTVLIKGTTQGAVSNMDGIYTISNIPDNGTLVFSFVGMLTQEIVVGDQTSINVSMRADAIGIEEVVAIGYGTVKKSDLTGAVSSVKAEDLPLAGNTSVQHMLSGKAAGVLVRANDAQPGGGLTVLIRGAASAGAGNEPLYIIDGFPVSGGADPGNGSRYSIGSRSPLNSINPNDIESIEILKDASSTAIYGARAANGVVLITTKTGEDGKVEVNYDFNQSFLSVSNPRDLYNAEEFMTATNNYRKERWKLDNNIAPYGATDPSSVQPVSLAYTDSEISSAGRGTDWFDEVTRQGRIQEHNISIRGGNAKTKFLVSINSFDQDGIVKENEFKRFSARLNFDQEIREWLKVGVKATGSKINFENPALGTGGAENVGVITSAYVFAPNFPVKNEDGEYSIVPNVPFFPNPVSLLEITNETQQDRLLAQAYVEIEPIRDLRVRSQFGIDKQEGIARLYLPKSTLYGATVGGQANINQNNKFDKLFNTTVSYKRDIFENHHLSALIGYEYSEMNWDGYGLGNTKFATDAFLYNNMAAGEAEKPSVFSYKGNNKLASYFGRVNYNISDKYLFTASLRADGSSKFGSGNKWGYFPSGAVAWKVSEENFLKNTDWISILKLRLSAGQTGNSNIPLAIAQYGFGANYLFGGNSSSGSYIASYSNENLKWETTTEYNFGLDFGLFNNRVNGSIELFDKVITDLLGHRQLASFLENSSVSANTGSTSSSGYELTLNTVNLTGDFQWSSVLTLSAYKDKWEERDKDAVLAVYQSEKDFIRNRFGYITDGLLQVGEAPPAHMPGLYPGQMKVKDINGFDENNELTGEPDGIINDADVVNLGNADPDFVVGFSNTFEYKSFDLNIHVYGMIGIVKYNKYLARGLTAYTLDRGENGNNRMSEFWSSENQDAEYPNNTIINPYPGGNQWLQQKADFIRVKNITLGYTLPKSIKFIERARVYADVANPFLFTNFTGDDPEYSGAYPVQKTFTVGLNIQF